MKLKHYFWAAANLYASVMARPRLVSFHRALLNLSLHGLGYDNARYTGEEWFIKNVLAKENPGVCVDVGANVGAYSQMLARYTNAHIYSIEPASAAFKELEKVAATHRGRIQTVNAALGSSTGTATLYLREHLSEKATLDIHSGKGSALQEEVRLTTLDALADELQITKVDFIKIDTEGYELEVFKGMQETLLKCRPKFIQFEFNHVHLVRNVTVYSLAQLLEHYDLYRLLPHGWIRIDPQKMSSNIFMFCNIIARQRKSNA
jgi:FkbM family methyltransferase